MSARMRRLLRAVPIDLIAFVAIAIAVIATHLSYLHRGMPFNDPAWYFHFGQRTLDGDVPYRDYVFQVGPLPIYVDAAFRYSMPVTTSTGTASIASVTVETAPRREPK